MRGTTILCHGTWDLIHLGHIRHLKEAKELGDRLVVSVTADKFVNKGHDRPQFSVEQRREALLMLECVDEVVISESANAVDVIRKIKPAVYVKGVDYASIEDDNLALERDAVEAVGGRFHTTTTEKWSSTKLLRNLRLPEEALDYIDYARDKKFLDKILVAFEKADKLKIVFVGETIMDEYRYVHPLARPSKEFILATVAAGSEMFEGGIIAAAKQGEWENASIVTSQSHIVKTRWVGHDFSRKLFEVYSHRTIEPGWFDAGLLKDEVELADVVIAIDFGHGLFDDGERDIVRNKSKFLAVTAQMNAGNWGYNSILRYEGAQYVCVDEQEARLAVGQQDGTIERVAARLNHHLKPKALVVTQGRRGSLAGPYKNTFKPVPAFIESGFDTMGAGDCFLSVSAPLIAAGLDVEMAAFAGNIAGGLKTTVLGHRRHVGRQDIIKNMEWLLK